MPEAVRRPSWRPSPWTPGSGRFLFIAGLPIPRVVFERGSFFGGGGGGGGGGRFFFFIFNILKFFSLLFITPGIIFGMVSGEKLK
mgnify:CR=1 FL=1